jgi:membrane-associated protease RseP (regulator of RpoE activity)
MNQYPWSPPENPQVPDGVPSAAPRDWEPLPPDFTPPFRDLSPWHSRKDYGVFFLLLLATIGATFLINGPLYSLSLMLILATHEFGHYWACRKNGVRASLPYFLPAPPIFIAGTFGAFIHVKEPIHDRRVLMEIGASGPIAGFVMALPILVIGLLNSQVSVASPAGQSLNFGSSLILFLSTKWVLGVDPLSPDINIALHPMAYAAWIGLFVTAINLLPIGQLDGGQVSFALFGEKCLLITRLFFACLLFLGFYWSGWWFFALLTAFMFRFRHAPIMDEGLPLQQKHKILGYVAVFIFVITFIPVPIEIIP